MPCSVTWEEGNTRGQIANISFGGALISEVTSVPPEGAVVALTFDAKEGPVRLKGKLTSRVIHTITELIEDGGVGSFGVQFEGSIEDIRAKLVPIFQVLTSGQDD